MLQIIKPILLLGVDAFLFLSVNRLGVYLFQRFKHSAAAECLLVIKSPLYDALRPDGTHGLLVIKR